MTRGKKAFLWMIATLAVFAGIAGITACSGKPKPAENATAAPTRPPRPVHTAVVESAVAGAVTVPATVAARQSATLAARIPAAVREMPLREGQAVAAGAVVVRLDDGALRSGLAAAEAGAQAAESDLARMQGLAQRGAATPREVEEASARAAASRAMVSAARENLSYAVLRSPFAGILAARKADVGDVVSPGQPLVEIEGRGGLELRATLSGTESQSLRPGATVEARVDGIAEPLHARITALSPAGDPATHRFELRADLPALPASAGLRSGLFARLDLPAAAGAQGGESLTVPAAAVFQRGGLTGVFVAEQVSDQNRARLRWIAPGAPAGDRIEIRAGLAAGERVVIDPGDLADGDPVLIGEEVK
jgi:RND family efflux transporter MFP subunit